MQQVTVMVCLRLSQRHVTLCLAEMLRPSPYYELWLNPAVIVLQADDVVLAQVVARLHFDEVQYLGSGILQAMHGAQWNICRLIGAKVVDVAVAGDACSAAHHHPM